MMCVFGVGPTVVEKSQWQVTRGVVTWINLWFESPYKYVICLGLLQVGRIQVIAFQSLDGKQNHMLRPVSLSPVNRSTVIDLESSLSSSENASTRSGFARADSLEQDTGDSRAVAGASKVYFG